MSASSQEARTGSLFFFKAKGLCKLEKNPESKKQLIKIEACLNKLRKEKNGTEKFPHYNQEL